MKKQTEKEGNNKKNRLKDVKVNVKFKTFALWITIMCIYIYADIFGFYLPGHLEDLIAGEIAGLQITQIILLGFMVLMTIPGLMVFLSLALNAKANRITNIIISILQIGLVIPSVIGESNIYFIFASVVELMLLSLIIWFALKWPKEEDNIE